MRGKYRSAIYTFEEAQIQTAKQALEDLQKDFEEQIITKVLPFPTFKLNEENYLDYYYKDPSKSFCQNIFSPKLKILMAKFAKHISLEHLPLLSAL
jgi:peptide-methionine (S)-S-oxide reductase